MPCKNCGECCLMLLFVIKTEDKERLEKLGHIIVKPYGTGMWRWYAPCPFYVESEAHHCSIYAVRPEYCKKYYCKEAQ